MAKIFVNQNGHLEWQRGVSLENLLFQKVDPWHSGQRLFTTREVVKRALPPTYRIHSHD